MTPRAPRRRPRAERLYALADPLVRGTDSLLGDFERHLDLAGGGRVHLAASIAAAVSGCRTI